MYYSLEGDIKPVSKKMIVVTVDGVSYECKVYDSSLIAGKVYVKLVHRDDSMTLYGFSTSIERFLFEDLLTVKKVGPSTALRLVSFGQDIFRLTTMSQVEASVFFKVGPTIASGLVSNGFTKKLRAKLE